MEQRTDPNATHTLRRKVDSASDSMHRAFDTASAAASPALKQMRASARRTVHKMAHGADYAAEAIAEKGEQLHHLQMQFARSARNRVRRHPLLAIGLAAVAGAVLFSWWLSHRRAERDKT